MSIKYMTAPCKSVPAVMTLNENQCNPMTEDLQERTLHRRDAEEYMLLYKIYHVCRDHSMYVVSYWETTLQWLSLAAPIPRMIPDIDMPVWYNTSYNIIRIAKVHLFTILNFIYLKRFILSRYFVSPYDIYSSVHATFTLENIAIVGWHLQQFF